MQDSQLLNAVFALETLTCVDLLLAVSEVLRRRLTLRRLLTLFPKCRQNLHSKYGTVLLH